MDKLWLGIGVGTATSVAGIMKGQEASKLGECVNDTVGYIALVDAV